MSVDVGDYDYFFDDNDRVPTWGFDSRRQHSHHRAAAQAEFGFGTDFLDVLMRTLAGLKKSCKR